MPSTVWFLTDLACASPKEMSVHLGTVRAVVGFTKLSDVTHRSAKSLMRMLGPSGNPQARNLFEIVAYLQYAEGVRFEVRSACGALRAKRAVILSGNKNALLLPLWSAKTPADCKINRIAAVSPAFGYNFSHVALCQSLIRNGGSPVARDEVSLSRISLCVNNWPRSSGGIRGHRSVA